MKLLLYQFFGVTAKEAKITAEEIGIPKTDAADVWQGALGLTYWIIGIVCVVMIIISGYKYVTSAGDPSAVTKAKNTLTFAIIGLIVVLLAFTVTQFIIGRIQQ
jgi:Ni,Fe-hydrogenase I cytochrome b subunit